MIIQATDTKKMDEILALIYELKGDDLETLWDWFNKKALVGGMIVDLPKETHFSEKDKKAGY